MILQFLRVIVVVQPPFEKAVVRPCARSVTPIQCDTRRIAAPHKSSSPQYPRSTHVQALLKSLHMLFVINPLS